MALSSHKYELPPGTRLSTPTADWEYSNGVSATDPPTESNWSVWPNTSCSLLVAHSEDIGRAVLLEQRTYPHATATFAIALPASSSRTMSSVRFGERFIAVV